MGKGECGNDFKDVSKGLAKISYPDPTPGALGRARMQKDGNGMTQRNCDSRPASSIFFTETFFTETFRNLAPYRRWGIAELLSSNGAGNRIPAAFFALAEDISRDK
jgi:hypothetical protein